MTLPLTPSCPPACVQSFARPALPFSLRLPPPPRPTVGARLKASSGSVVFADANCVRHEEYFDEEGDGKSEGCYIFENIADELKHDSRSVGWGDPDCEKIERPNRSSLDWTVGGMPGPDFVKRVNEHFENGTVGWSLLDFPCAGYGIEDVLSGGEFEI